MSEQHRIHICGNANNLRKLASSVQIKLDSNLSFYNRFILADGYRSLRSRYLVNDIVIPGSFKKGRDIVQQTKGGRKIVRSEDIKKHLHGEPDPFDKKGMSRKDIMLYIAFPIIEADKKDTVIVPNFIAVLPKPEAYVWGEVDPSFGFARPASKDQLKTMPRENMVRMDWPAKEIICDVVTRGPARLGDYMEILKAFTKSRQEKFQEMSKGEQASFWRNVAHQAKEGGRDFLQDLHYGDWRTIKAAANPPYPVWTSVESAAPYELVGRIAEAAAQNKLELKVSVPKELLEAMGSVAKPDSLKIFGY